MAIPNKIYDRMVSGVIGEVAFDGPTRARTAILSSTDETNNLFASAYTFTDVSATTVAAGGAGVFAGLMISPKANGSGELYVPNGEQSEFLDMGEIYADVDGADETTAIKTPVYYIPATGKLTITSTDNTLVPNCVIERNAPSAVTPTLCVLRLTN